MIKPLDQLKHIVQNTPKKDELTTEQACLFKGPRLWRDVGGVCCRVRGKHTSDRTLGVVIPLVQVERPHSVYVARWAHLKTA